MSDQVLQIPTAAAVAAQGTEHANKRDPDGQLVASSKTSAPGQSNGQEEVDIINSLLSEWRDELSGAVAMGTLEEGLIGDCSAHKTAEANHLEQASQLACAPQHAASLAIAAGLTGLASHPNVQMQVTSNALGAGPPAGPLDPNKVMLPVSADNLHAPTYALQDVPPVPGMQPYLAQPHLVVGASAQQSISGHVQNSSLVEYMQAQAAINSSGVHASASSFGWRPANPTPWSNPGSSGALLGPSMQQDIAPLPGCMPAAQPAGPFNTAFDSLANAPLNPLANAAVNPLANAAFFFMANAALNPMANAALNPMAQFSQILAQGLAQQQRSLAPGQGGTLPSSRGAAAAAVAMQPNAAYCASAGMFEPTATAATGVGWQHPQAHPIQSAVAGGVPPVPATGQQVMATPELVQQQQQLGAGAGHQPARTTPRPAHVPLPPSAVPSSSCEVPLASLSCGIAQEASAPASSGLLVQDEAIKAAPAAVQAGPGSMLPGLPHIPLDLMAPLSGLPFLQGAPANNPSAAAAAAAAAAAVSMLPGAWPMHLPGLLRPPSVPAPNLSQLALMMQAAVHAAAVPGEGVQHAAMLAAAMQSLAASSMPGMFGPPWTGVPSWQQQQHPPPPQQALQNNGSYMIPMGHGYIPPQVAGGSGMLGDPKVTMLSSSHPHAGSHHQTSTTGDHSGQACDLMPFQSQRTATAQMGLACDNPGPSLTVPQQQQQWPLQEKGAAGVGCRTAVELAPESAGLDSFCLHNSSRSQQGLVKRKVGDGRRTRASNRPRVKGRFVKKGTPGAAVAGAVLDATEQQHTSSDHEASEGETVEDHHAMMVTSFTQVQTNIASRATASGQQLHQQQVELRHSGEVPSSQQQLAVTGGTVFHGGAADPAGMFSAPSNVQLFSPDNAACAWAGMSHVPDHSSSAACHTHHIALQQPLSACAGFMTHSVSTFAGVCPAQHVHQQQQWAAGVPGQCDWPVATAGLTCPASAQRVERLYSSRRSWVMEHLDGPARSDPSTTVCDSGTAGQLPDCGVYAAQQNQRQRQRSCSSLPGAAEPSASDGGGFPGLFSAPIGCLAAAAGGSLGAAAGADRGMHTSLHLCDSNRLTSTQQQLAARQADRTQLPPLSSGKRSNTAAFHTEPIELLRAAAAAAAPVSLSDALIPDAQAPVCVSAPDVEDILHDPPAGQHPPCSSRLPLSSSAPGFASGSHHLVQHGNTSTIGYGYKRQKLAGDACPGYGPGGSTPPAPLSCDAALPPSTLTAQAHNQYTTAAAALSAPLLRVASAPLDRAAAAAQMPPPAAHPRPHSASFAANGSAGAPGNSSHTAAAYPTVTTRLSPAVVASDCDAVMPVKHGDGGVETSVAVIAAAAGTAAVAATPQGHMYPANFGMLWQHAQEQVCVPQAHQQPSQVWGLVHSTQPLGGHPSAAAAASAGCGLQQLAGLIAPPSGAHASAAVNLPQFAAQQPQPNHMATLWPLAAPLNPWVNPSLAAAVAAAAAAAAANRPLAATGGATPGMLPAAAMPGNAFLSPFVAAHPTSPHPSMLVAAAALNDVGGALLRQGRASARAADVRYGATAPGTCYHPTGASWKQQAEGSEQADSCLP